MSAERCFRLAQPRGLLLEGAKLYLERVNDIAESAPWDDWSNEIRDAQNLVQKLERMQT